MKTDQDRPLAGEFFFIRQEQPCADGQTIETLDLHQLRTGKAIQVNAGRRGCCCPALRLTGGDVQAIDIAGALW